MGAGADKLIVSQQGDVTVIHFVDAKVLDQTNINAIGQELIDLVEKSHRIHLLINFEKVEYLSSAVLGKLIALQKRIALRRGKLVLCSIRPSIYEVFKITRLDRVFEICEGEGEAITAFGSVGQ